ncbi:MAG: hypothetical protein KF866_04535 [Phycisphaeraceae bacterium]|nr:hypothetical protein [Phycisphaeraceae bacterium]
MNHRTVAYAFGLVMLTLALAACAGFDLGDVVKVRTPNAIQQTTGLPARVSLNEAEAEYRAWFENVQRTGAQWKASIERAGEIRGLLGQLTLSALDDVGPTLAGVPVVGPALPALTGIVGLFIGSGRLRKEKEASFNKGLKEGKTLNGGAAA